jgi:hypothetical protein
MYLINILFRYINIQWIYIYNLLRREYLIRKKSKKIWCLLTMEIGKQFFCPVLDYGNCRWWAVSNTLLVVLCS